MRVLLLVSVSLFLSQRAAAQIRCVSDCSASPELIGIFTSIRECCTINNGGGIAQAGSEQCFDCTPFRDLDPQLSLSFDPPTPVVGESFTGTCNVTTAPDVQSFIQVEWTDSSGNVLSSSTGMGSVEVDFTIDSYSAITSTFLGGFRCRTTINSTDVPAVVTLSRSIGFAVSEGTSVIQGSGDITIGSQFNLTCTVSGASPPLNIFWAGPSGVIDTDTPNIRLVGPVTDGDDTSLTLVFDPLTSDVTGTYICSNTGTIPGMVSYDLFTGGRRIVSNTPILNQQYSATCGVDVPDDLQATVDVIWLNPAGVAIARATGVSSAEATFTIPSLGQSDIGEYTCRAIITSPRLNTPLTVDRMFPVGEQILPVDRCADSADPCPDPNARCEDMPEGARCVCDTGYVLADDETCNDIDECSEGLDECDDNARCTNTPGSYSCTCESGYQGDGFDCEDIDECVAGSDNCHRFAFCTNTEGSFDCTCCPGFRGNGRRCRDINECREDLDNCHANARCINIVGSYRCRCNSGFRGNGRVCIAIQDIDQCARENLNRCDSNADCIDLPRGYRCECRDGYVGNGRRCRDVNECNMGTDNCHSDAVCTNTQGSFLCQCRAGFEGDGVTCTAIEAQDEEVEEEEEGEGCSTKGTKSTKKKSKTTKSRSTGDEEECSTRHTTKGTKKTTGRQNNNDDVQLQADEAIVPDTRRTSRTRRRSSRRST